MKVVEMDSFGKMKLFFPVDYSLKKNIILPTCAERQPIFHSYVLYVNKKKIPPLTKLITEICYANLTY